jgi:predicted PurR-regulated permease PerM
MLDKLKDKIKEKSESSSWLISGTVISIVLFVLLQFGIIGKNNQIEELANKMTQIALSNENRVTKLETRQDYMDQQISSLIKMIERHQIEIKQDLRDIKIEIKGKP